MKLPDDDIRVSPLASPGRVVRRFGGRSDHPIDFFLYQDVIEELTFAATYEDRIYGAVLTGGFGFTDVGSGFVEITGFVGGSWSDSIEDLYRPLREQCEEWAISGNSATMAGCFIAEPGGGALVAAEAARIHYSLFNIPYQPLVMFDPAARALSVSARGSGTPMSNFPFAVVVTKTTGDEEE